MVFRIDWKQVPVALQGLLPTLGRSKDVVHIRLYPSERPSLEDRVEPLWSRGEYIQMVQTVQENGASGLRSFILKGWSLYWTKGCEAMRIGWLDIPQQPTLTGEWRFDISKGI